MSFRLTTVQFEQRTKTVTRRLGWWNLKVGDVVMGVEKGMGLKKGEKVRRLHAVKVVSVGGETLLSMHRFKGREETTREGFPDLYNHEFIEMFRRHHGCSSDVLVNRIELEHLP